jgi:hypothetical protein
MTPQENIQQLYEAKDAVLNHPMCLHLQHVDGKYRVIYPEGVCLDGCQSSYADGHAEALKRLLSVMERHYLQSTVR